MEGRVLHIKNQDGLSPKLSRPLGRVLPWQRGPSFHLRCPPRPRDDRSTATLATTGGSVIGCPFSLTVRNSSIGLSPLDLCCLCALPVLQNNCPTILRILSTPTAALVSAGRQAASLGVSGQDVASSPGRHPHALTLSHRPSHVALQWEQGRRYF